VEAIAAIAGQINAKTGFQQTLLQMIPGFQFILNDQDLHQ
jgi:hypothetical protein